jgi:putative FmdB family regulatory protein
MPHYDYKCTNCGYQFELFQKMNEEPVTFCPSCGGKVKRLIGTGAGAIFKGSGFYHTDYKMKGEGKKQSKKTDTPSDPKPQEGKKDKKQTD